MVVQFRMRKFTMTVNVQGVAQGRSLSELLPAVPAELLTETIVFANP